MTALTLPLVAVWVATLVARRPMLAVAAGGITPTGAFLVAGTIALPTLYASVIFFLAVELVTRIRHGALPPAPSLLALWVLALWLTVVTLLAPFLFPGVLVATLGSAPHTLGSAGFLTSSNIAQLLYLFLDVALAAAAARRPGGALLALFVSLAGSSALSLWRYAGLHAGLPYPFGLFDDSPGFRYIDGAPGGVERFRGIFSEPAGLAASALTAVAVAVALVPRLRTVRARVAALAVAAASAFELAQSTSASGLIAAALVAGVAALVWIGDWSSGHVARRPTTLVTAIAGVLVALAALAPLVGYLSAVVNAKVGTASFDERSGNDALSYGLLLETDGFGVGVGANRPSSFLASLVAAGGLIGVLLFLGTVAWIVQRSIRLPAARPVLWALCTALVVKFISSPDLSDTSGVLWLAVGAAAGWAHLVEVRRPEPVLPSRHRAPMPGVPQRPRRRRGTALGDVFGDQTQTRIQST